MGIDYARAQCSTQADDCADYHNHSYQLGDSLENCRDKKDR